MRIVARESLDKGLSQIPLKAISAELGLTELAAKRLAVVLSGADRIWRMAGPPNLDFSMQPLERTIWLKDVNSIDEYFSIQHRVDVEEAEGRTADQRELASILTPGKSVFGDMDLSGYTSDSPQEQNIFLSHSSDDKLVAQYLSDRLLELVPQSRVFLASRPGDIPVGAEWLEIIKEKLTQSSAYLVLLTETSIERPWVQFETGAAWMSERQLVTVTAGPLKKTDIAMPLAAFQLYSLSIPEEARHVFEALGGQLPNPEGFSARVRELTGAALEAIDAAAGWSGVSIGKRFFAWGGPSIYELKDWPGVPNPPGLIEAITGAHMTPTFGLRSKITHHLAAGRLQVYETDRKRWRREVLYSADGDQVLLVHPSEEDRNLEATSLAN
jgi:hypothetical protein